MATHRLKACATSLKACATSLALLLGLSALALFPARLESRPSPRKNQLARQQFERAEKLRAGLASKPEEERRAADYRAALRAYDEVVYLAPTLRLAPESLFRAAQLYQEMAQRFAAERGAEKYAGAARAKYEFLLKEYPQNSYRAEAKKALAELEEAPAPVAPETAEAKKPKVQSPRSKVPEPQEADAGTAAGAPQRAASEEAIAARHRNPVQVSGIRQWATPSYTRVVVDLDDEVEYEAGRITNPERIYFDLHNTRLPHPLRKSIPVGSGFLKEIRLAQNRSNLTRIVLDVDQIGSYSAFLLPNPYRLVIDIRGETKPRRAEETAPATKARPAPDVAAESKAGSAPAPPASAKRALDSPPAAETAARQTPPKTPPAATAPVSAAKPAEAPPVPADGQPGAASVAKRPAVLVAEATTPKPDPPSKEASTVVPSTTGPTSKPLYEAVKPARPTHDGRRSLTRALGLKIGRIVIDAGHGGYDTGTIGPSGFAEKELVLDVAKRLGALLEERLGAEPIYTRSEDVFVPLEARTAMANQMQADLFVSVHANASRDRRARGVETYYLNFTTAQDALEVAARENAVSEKSIHELQDLVKKITLHEKVDESREFAAEVQKSLYSGMARGNVGMRNRGVKKAPFIVLIGANMPSILAEISFVTNPQDERLLKRPEYRQRVAEALFRGIQRYVSSLSGVKVAKQVPAMESLSH